MTDTTDTSVLRREALTLDRMFKTERFIGKLLDLLEAERQRADEYRYCIRVLADQLSVNALPKEVIEAVAELKAKLANPVVMTDCTFEAVSHMAHWYSEGECVAWVSGAEHVKKQILEAGFTVNEE